MYDGKMAYLAMPPNVTPEDMQLFVRYIEVVKQAYRYELPVEEETQHP
jgi:hypothetical protein